MKSEAIHIEEYRSCTIKLIHDDNPESPREWCNVGTMVCWHGRYNLGDERPRQTSEDYLQNLARCAVSGNYPEALLLRNQDKILAKHFVIIPLYLYDHSGTSISARPFSCRWDSGQVGFIYCTMEQARKEWPGLTDGEARAKAVECLLSEVEVYDAFLQGDVVGWVAEGPDGNTIDSCWGFFPDDREGYAKRWDYPISEAKASIDHWCEEQATEAAEAAHWAARDTVTK